MRSGEEGLAKFEIQKVKVLSRTLFAAYLLMLLWLVLFKFSYDPIAVVRDFQTRSLNLIPFARSHTNEVVSNIIAFIPFGVMLGVDLKHLPFKYKITAIFGFSLAVEVIQFALAIGVSDITDVIMNTLGGFSGLALYYFVSKWVVDKYLDGSILAAGTVILVTILYLRIFVFIVRY